MNEELKNKFKNGMIPDEIAFGQLIDEATKEADLSGYATKAELPVVPDVSQFITLEDIPPTDLSDYAKVADIPSLEGLLSETNAGELYVKKSDLTNLLENYVKEDELPTEFNSEIYKHEFLEEHVFSSNNLFNRNGSIIYGKMIDTSGALVEDTTMITTDYPIPVKQGASYYATAGVYISQYTQDGVFLSQNLQSISSSFTPNHSTAYIKLSLKKTFIARFAMSEASSTINANDHYIPYEIRFGGNTTINRSFNEVDALNFFIEHMNKKAKKIGMSNTVFHNPSGLNSEGQVTSSRDVLKLLLNAASYNEIIKVWGVKQHTLKIDGKSNKDLNISTTVTHSSLEDFYKIQGGKTGTITSAGTFYNLATICSDIEGNLYATVVLGAPTLLDRFNDTKIAIDSIINQTENPEFSATSVSAIKLQPNQHLFLSNIQDSVIIKEENTTVPPASITKIMTAILMLENIENLQQKFEIRRVDLVGGSGNYFKEGDIISFEDALYLLMLPSSNVVAQAIARIVGRKLYYAENNVFM